MAMSLWPRFLAHPVYSSLLSVQQTRVLNINLKSLFQLLIFITFQRGAGHNLFLNIIRPCKGLILYQYYITSPIRFDKKCGRKPIGTRSRGEIITKFKVTGSPQLLEKSEPEFKTVSDDSWVIFRSTKMLQVSVRPRVMSRQNWGVNDTFLVCKRKTRNIQSIIGMGEWGENGEGESTCGWRGGRG